MRSPADDGVDDADDAGDEAGATEARVVELTVSIDAAGVRLDAFVTDAIPELTRAQARRLIDEGAVTIDGRAPDKAGEKLRIGARLRVTIAAPTPLELVAEDLPVPILYQDADVVVVDKPAGLVVHPAPGHPRGTLVNALLFHCRDLAGIGGVQRPGIVHRLDRDTSGVMVVAKNDAAHTALAAQFAAKSRGEAGGIQRQYVALVAPPPTAGSGTLRTLHGRHPVDRKRFSSKVETGKPAVTHWRVIERLPSGEGGPGPDAAVVQLVLETGRTHQIRVHAADHGWPLVGDQVYGGRPRTERVAAVAAALGRQALHAEELGFVHPRTGERLRFRADLPADLARAIAALRVL